MLISVSIFVMLYEIFCLLYRFQNIKKFAVCLMAEGFSYYNTVVENYTGYCCYFQFDPICSLWLHYLMVTVAKHCVSVLWVGG